MSRKRRPLGGNMAIVAQAVADLKNEFQYPDVAGRGIAAASPQAGGGGGAPTVVVAASNATGLSKAKADFICSGTNDEEVINAAMQVAFGIGGRVLLTEGTFDIAAPVEFVGDVHLQGMREGDATILLASVAGDICQVADDCTISDLTITGAGSGYIGVAGNGTGAGQFVGRNLRMVNLETAFEPEGDDWTIEGCTGNIITKWIDSTAGHNYLRMSGCLTAGQINTNGSNFVTFGSNIYRGVINLGTTAEGIDIRGVLDSPGGTSAAVVQGTSITGFIIDLTAYECFGYDAPAFTSSSDGEIRGVYGDVTAGVVLDGCTNVYVDAIIGANGYLGEHGVSLADCTRCVVRGRIISPGQDLDNTYDGVILSGNSDLNDVRVVVSGAAAAPQPRYAINVSAATCNDNAIVGNNFSDPGGTLYGTARFNDAGTGTITLWSSGGPNGDNIN